VLHINPFYFPVENNKVHVLEHIDRMVDVFNTCWPMYASMPVLLKEAVGKAYESVGWNLRTSKCVGENIYPTFDDLLEVMPSVIEKYGYAGEANANLNAGLLARVYSLTRDILGLVFSKNTKDADLFSRNVVVDFSSVDSNETKSLLMGMLIIRLKEYRIDEGIKECAELRHITVLEEAHHLLRSIPTEQNQESTNLQGKSVEMISNAIAEMRTYGQGFLIVDQSPGLLDKSVIRNTNTKIILNLKEIEDRILAGRAAGMNDTQIEEIAKLAQGVAAIHQSGWLEPVLCNIHRFTDKRNLESRFGTDRFEWQDDELTAVQKFMRYAILDLKECEPNADEISAIMKWRNGLHLSIEALKFIEYSLEGNELDDKKKMLLLYDLIGNKIADGLSKTKSVKEVNSALFGRFGFDVDDRDANNIKEYFVARFLRNPYENFAPTFNGEVAIR